MVALTPTPSLERYVCHSISTLWTIVTKTISEKQTALLYRQIKIDTEKSLQPYTFDVDQQLFMVQLVVGEKFCANCRNFFQISPVSNNIKFHENLFTQIEYSKVFIFSLQF